jgi:hypothetical protein
LLIIKGKNLLIAAVFLAIALVSSCTLMVKGDVYIGYGWDPYISQFYDSNPVIYYGNIVQDTYYKSDTGTYYGSYKSSNGWYYSYEYTLAADYASVDSYYGPYNAYFYIYLSDNGPTVYDPTYSRSLSSDKGSEKRLSKSMEVGANSPLTKRNLGEPTGILERTTNGYTMHLKYWKVE